MRRLITVALAAAAALSPFLVDGAIAGEATLTWDDGPNGGIVRWYDIYEKPSACADGGKEWGKVARDTSVETRERKRIGLTEGLTYCWRVTAGNNNFESGPSNEVAKTIPFSDTMPADPAGLQVR